MAISAFQLEQQLQPQSAEHDKFQSLLNILKGCEEFVLDVNGDIVSSNLEVVTITGYEEWEVIGKNISIFYCEEDQRENKPERDLQKALKLGKYISSGFRVKKKGTQFWAKMKFFTQYDSAGAFKGYRIVLYDTTHRAVYAMNTRRIKEEYLSLFNNSFIGIFKCSLKDFTFLMLNDRALQITGKDRDGLKLQDIFFNKDDYQRFTHFITERKSLENFEFRLSGQTERYATISCKIFVLGGFIEGVLADTTEKRKQFLQLERINQQLDSVNSELDNFLYHASHDIRAPLATVLGLINLIKNEVSLEKIQEYNSKISERVKHLDSLLRDLSAVAYNNSQPVVIEQVNVNKVLRDTLRLFEKDYPFIKTKLTLNAFSEFNTDVFRFGTIINNIISNAFKYYNPNTRAPFVNIQCDCYPSEAIILIEDNGRGIHHKHIKDVFKLFFKMDSRGTGSGLGLYVVQIMMNKLGGTVELSSKPGVGTSIVLKIPNKIHQPISIHQ